MRWLAFATLFLGTCLIDPGPDSRTALALARGAVFFAALIVIWFSG
jgi:hypothetical protein